MAAKEFHELAKRVSNWGRWGEADELGTLNLITPEVLVRAAACVQTGKVFNLGLVFGPEGPQTGAGGRFNPHHFVSALGQPMTDEPEGFCYSDDVVHMPLQCATQWDALSHVHYADKIYNGFKVTEALGIDGAARVGIDKAAQKGIASRGVLLDIARLKGVDRLGHEQVTVADLVAAESSQGVAVESGDILLLRTGHIRAFTVDRNRKAFMGPQPGLGVECAAWLRERDVAAVAADNVAVEMYPPLEGGTGIPLHMLCLRDMGLMFGEMFFLDELAEDCAADGRWSCFLSAPPLAVERGFGSPINPQAFK